MFTSLLGNPAKRPLIEVTDSDPKRIKQTGLAARVEEICSVLPGLHLDAPYGASLRDLLVAATPAALEAAAVQTSSLNTRDDALLRMLSEMLAVEETRLDECCAEARRDADTTRDVPHADLQSAVQQSENDLESINEDVKTKLSDLTGLAASCQKAQTRILVKATDIFLKMVREDFEPLKSGTLEKDSEMEEHLTSLHVAMLHVDLEPCLREAFPQTMAKRPAEWGDFDKVIVEALGAAINKHLDVLYGYIESCEKLQDVAEPAEIVKFRLHRKLAKEGLIERDAWQESFERLRDGPCELSELQFQRHIVSVEALLEAVDADKCLKVALPTTFGKEDSERSDFERSVVEQIGKAFLKHEAALKEKVGESVLEEERVLKPMYQFIDRIVQSARGQLQGANRKRKRQLVVKEKEKATAAHNRLELLKARSQTVAENRISLTHLLGYMKKSNIDPTLLAGISDAFKKAKLSDVDRKMIRQLEAHFVSCFAGFDAQLQSIDEKLECTDGSLCEMLAAQADLSAFKDSQWSIAKAVLAAEAKREKVQLILTKLRDTEEKKKQLQQAIRSLAAVRQQDASSGANAADAGA